MLTDCNGGSTPGVCVCNTALYESQAGTDTDR